MSLYAFGILVCLAAQIVTSKILFSPSIDSNSDAICGCDNNIVGSEEDEDDIQFRIVGGHETKHHAYPQMVSIRYNLEMCGGTIINSEYLLTAAHCVVNRDILSGYAIEAGKHDLYVTEPTEKKLYLKNIIIHPEYNPKTKENDIAVLQLTSPIIFNEYIKPVCLPLFDRTYTSKLATAIGWGDTEKGIYSPRLREVDLSIMSRIQCAEYFTNRNFASMFCAGYVNGGKDTCIGDSGGPLFIKTSPPTQVGVISFGKGCARPKSPGMNSDVGYNIKFILDNTKISSGCQIYSHDKI